MHVDMGGFALQNPEACHVVHPRCHCIFTSHLAGVPLWLLVASCLQRMSMTQWQMWLTDSC